MVAHPKIEILTFDVVPYKVMSFYVCIMATFPRLQYDPWNQLITLYIISSRTKNLDPMFAFLNCTVHPSNFMSFYGWIMATFLGLYYEPWNQFITLSRLVASAAVTALYQIRELSFFIGRGAVCLWWPVANFFWSPLCIRKKILAPFGFVKKFWLKESRRRHKRVQGGSWKSSW